MFIHSMVDSTHGDELATDWKKVTNRQAIFTAASVILILFGSACGAREEGGMAGPTAAPVMLPPEARSASPSSEPPDFLTAGATSKVDDIIRAPKSFLGKTVTLVADVEEVFSSRAFTLKETDQGSSFLLTLVPKVGRYPSVDDRWKGGKARVTGVVEPMLITDVEREIGWELPEDLKSRFRSGIVLIVRSVERIDQ